jgi:hypothetical protein
MVCRDLSVSRQLLNQERVGMDAWGVKKWTDGLWSMGGIKKWKICGDGVCCCLGV